MGVMGTPFQFKNILFASFITDISAGTVIQFLTTKKTGTTRVPSFLLHLEIYLIIPEQFQQQY